MKYCEWDSIETLFGRDWKREIVAHHIDSYDDFVCNRISDVVAGFNPIRLQHSWDDNGDYFKLYASIDVSCPRLSRPSATEHDGTVHPMTPDVARSRHFTYAGDLLADLTVRVSTQKDGCEQASFELSFPGTKIGRLPIMVYSMACIYNDPATRVSANVCPMDPGGYFIVGGNERVIVPQDRMSENRIFVFPVNKTVSYSFAAESRSLVSERFGVPKLTVVKVSTRANASGHFAHATMHHVSANIPLFLLLRALGLQSDKDMFAHLSGTHVHGNAVCRFMSGCSADCLQHGVFDKESAIQWIASHCTAPSFDCGVGGGAALSTDPNAIQKMLATELLPHVGGDSGRKAEFLCDMARRCAVVAMGLCSPDDRDSYANKRVDPPGVLLGNLFRQSYGRFAKEARKKLAGDLSTRCRQAHKDLANVVSISSIASPVIIENGMRTSLATGNWGMKNNAKSGVSQILSRMTFSATLSHLRRVCTSIEKNSKLVHPRKLHSSQWGVFCPAETPEGHSVGVVKNLAIGARITIPSCPDFCRTLILRGECGPLIEPMSPLGTSVLVNYSPVCKVSDPLAFVSAVRRMRRVGLIHAHSSVLYDRDNNQVRILFDGGRLVRPLLIVENGHIQASDVSPASRFENHVVGGSIEYIDIEEASVSLIAMRPCDVGVQHTHCELHPCLCLGVLASMIPFSNHNQSPRNSYQSAMGKQAIGIFASNFRKRFDTHAMVLNYPQTPLVSPRISRMLGFDTLPSGANLIVAVSTMAGYNQEDSVVINKSAIERGMFETSVYHTIYEQVQKNAVTGVQEVFYMPSQSDTELSALNYSKLGSNGFPDMETHMVPGDVVIGKYMPHKGGVVTDESAALRTNESGKVDSIVAPHTHGDDSINGDGYAFCQVRLRDSRSPEIGDKVASRAGQKGTVGMTLKHEDMPVTACGLVPDIVINPHALPSRMTVGQLLEGVLGKACCFAGVLGDATPFDNDFCCEGVFDALSRCGCERHGEEVVYDPRTGRQCYATMFITPTYYQRLKHMVTDKVHGRGGSGPMVMLTRQPAEGRARDGGLRLGEMEIECLLAHGQMKFLKERFMTCSDAFRVDVCSACGAIATTNIKARTNTCRRCQNSRAFTTVDIPYAMKLMLQEVGGMGIGTSLAAS